MILPIFYIYAQHIKSSVFFNIEVPMSQGNQISTCNFVWSYISSNMIWDHPLVWFVLKCHHKFFPAILLQVFFAYEYPLTHFPQWYIYITLRKLSVEFLCFLEPCLAHKLQKNLWGVRESPCYWEFFRFQMVKIRLYEEKTRNALFKENVTKTILWETQVYYIYHY